MNWLYDIAEVLLRVIMYPFSNQSFKRESLILIIVTIMVITSLLIISSFFDKKSTANEFSNFYIIKQ